MGANTMIHKWAIDIDGVITANPAALSWLTYHLLKNENQNEVYIISWRDGSDEKRVKETEDDLKTFGIKYTKLVMAPGRFETVRVAAFWKVSKIRELQINTWLDDELKSYVRDYNLNLDDLLPDVNKIHI